MLPRRLKARIKEMLPANLFARTLLILLVPMVLLQLLTAHIFFSRHWDSVVRNMSSTTAADVAVLMREYTRVEELDGHKVASLHIWRMGQMMGITTDFTSLTKAKMRDDTVGNRRYPTFYKSLDLRIHDAFMLTDMPASGMIRVSIVIAPRVLQLTFGAKRLASDTTSIFLLWMVGTSLILVAIASLFLRNQIRPIVQLSRASEQFGLGQDVQNFSPRGASEIRRAGRAFLLMADRIRRSVQSRTEMLAGISHDLRTPLTRMKLEMEMGTIDTTTREALAADIEEMRQMIDEYLDFARGDAAEPMEMMDIAALLHNLCQQYAKQGANVALIESQPVQLMVRPQALRRALTNLIDNALRYGGGTAHLTLEQSVAFVRIKVQDRGPGIPDHQREHVFKPFTRLEPSRNTSTGGVGLGLSIARDIAQSHGGDVTLENQKDEAGAITGLEATIRLPREVQSLS